MSIRITTTQYYLTCSRTYLTEAVKFFLYSYRSVIHTMRFLVGLIVDGCAGGAVGSAMYCYIKVPYLNPGQEEIYM